MSRLVTPKTEREWSRSSAGRLVRSPRFNMASPTGSLSHTDDRVQSLADEFVDVVPYSPSCPSVECRSLTIPIAVSSPPAEPLVIQLCIHSNWSPSSATTIVHFIHNRVSFSHGGLHAPAVSVATLPVVQLWREASVDSDRSESAPIESPGLEESLPIECEYSDPPRSLNRPSWIYVAAIMAIISIAITILLPTPKGYYAHVTTFTSQETVPLSVSITLDAIYTSYIERLLPVVTPIQTNTTIWFPSSIIAGLIEEIDEVRLGVVSWDASSIPGPTDPGVLFQQVETCLTTLDELQADLIHLSRFLPMLAGHVPLAMLISVLQAIQAEEVDASMDMEHVAENRTARAITALSGTIQNLHERNDAVLTRLQRISRQLEPLLERIDDLLDEMVIGLEPYERKSKWVPRVLDAAYYARTTLLPIASLISGTAVLAVPSLIAANSTLTEELARYKNGTIMEETILRKVDHGWLLGYLEEEKVVRRYVFNEELVVELEEVLVLGSAVTKGVEDVKKLRDQDIDWTYGKVRPARPG